MKLINRHKGCWGITLYRWKRKTAEIWFCPPNFQIEEHTHPQEDIELMFLLGDAAFCRRKTPSSQPEELHVVSPWWTFTKFSVKRGYSHWFNTSTRLLIFINFAKWYCEPTSAATDFQLTDTTNNPS